MAGIHPTKIATRFHMASSVTNNTGGFILQPPSKYLNPQSQAALLAVMGSAHASAVPITESTSGPVYNWRVLDGGLDTPLPPASNGTVVLDLTERSGPSTVLCYNSGRAVVRAGLITAIDTFCNSVAIGTTLKSGQNLWRRYTDDFSGITILVWMEMTNGCTWKIDTACNVNFRRPVDECNTSTENDKQGGELTDGCAHYRIDPGDKGSNDQ